jgi:hypothetical protein
MKKIGILFAIILFIVGCDKDKKEIFNSSDLVGRWKFAYQLRDGVKQTLYPDQYCKYDQRYEFHADGIVTGNDPCQWNDLTLSKANWRIEDGKLFVDYYAIDGISVNPVIVRLTKDTLELQQKYGDVTVIRNVFARDKDYDFDYAADATGRYVGYMNYSQWYIFEDWQNPSAFRGDSIPAEILVQRNNWGNLSVVYYDIDVLGTTRTIQVDSMQTTRYENSRMFSLAQSAGTNRLFIDPVNIYNIRSSGHLGTIDADSIYFSLNFSKTEFKIPGDITSGSTENFYQYQRFRGKKTP